MARSRIIALSEEADTAFAAKDYIGAAGKIEELLKLLGPTPDVAADELELLHFNLALAYLLSGNASEAESAFKKCVAKYPKGEFASRCYLGVGKACLAQGKEKQETALKALRRAKEDRALRSEACLALGTLLADMGNRKEALTELRGLIGADIRTPEQTTAAVEVVSLLADNGDLADLVVYMDRLLNQAGVRDAIAWFSNQVVVRADEAVNSEDYDTALTIYESVPSRAQILEIQQQSLDAQRKLLRILEDKAAAERAKPEGPRTKAGSMAITLKSSVDAAAKAVETITKKADLDATLLMRRGRCLFYLKRYEEALVCFRTLRTKYASSADAKSASYAEIIIYSELKNYKELQTLCDAYLNTYPDADNAEQVACLAGELLVQDGKWPEVGKYYEKLEARFPKSANLGRFIFFQAASHFYDATFDKSTPLLQRFLKDNPDSELVETAYYYLAMTKFLSNKYKETLAACATYLEKFPEGRYAGDMQYRLSFIDFNDQEDQSAKIIRELEAYISKHPDDLATGSMGCLLGDTYKKKGEDQKALEAYKKAIWSDSPDDVVQYALDTATALLQTRREWGAIAELHGEFLKKYPKSPLAMLSATWVVRMKSREGKQQEAANMLADFLKSSIGNPASDQVELLIDELVKVSMPRKKAAEIDADAVDKKLVETMTRAGAEENPTANARLSYARARLAQMLKRQDRYELYLRGVAKNNADNPAVLSPALLSMCGETLLKDGIRMMDEKPDEATKTIEEAEAMFKRLADRYKDSMFADAGPVGLGNVALARKQFDEAYRIFDEALTTNPGSYRFKEASVGKLQALVELGKYAEAEKFAIETIGDKTFRGEFCGKAYLVQARMYREQAAKAAGTEATEFLKRAHAVYQRVYVAHKAYPEVCADGFWGAYEVLKQLGELSAADDTINLLLSNPKLENTSAYKKASRFRK